MCITQCLTRPHDNTYTTITIYLTLNASVMIDNLKSWHLKNKLLTEATVYTQQQQTLLPCKPCMDLWMIQENVLSWPCSFIPPSSTSLLFLFTSALICFAERNIALFTMSLLPTEHDQSFEKKKDFACGRVNEVTDANGEPNTGRALTASFG